MGNKRISYFMDTKMGGFSYHPRHNMIPHRLCLTHNLTIAYGLYRQMNVFRPKLATPDEMTNFHAEDYVDFLSRVTPDNVSEYAKQLSNYNLEKGGSDGGDCPVFEGFFEFCQLYTGGSIDGARRLINGDAHIAVNWSGGLHHAKKSSASGFCFVNDIVLSILELLKMYPRVLYIDIDYHHGDGVEEAFYVTDRVMTCSFHRWGAFPGTGDVWDLGRGEGKGYSVNLPLKGGITDDSYHRIFKPVIQRIMTVYDPKAIVLQCGADSLANDPVGDFNMTLKGHGECVRYVKSFGVPTLVLGGGGYKIESAARCWAYETAVLLDTALEDTIPYNDYWTYFENNPKLHFAQDLEVRNRNADVELDRLTAKVFENLRDLNAAPSVQIQDVPPQPRNLDDDDDDQDPDVRPVVDRAASSNEFFNHDADQGMEGLQNGR